MKSWSDNIKYEHMLAGLSGGVVSTLVLHPFDLIKVRFQVNDGTVIQNRQVYTGVVNAFSTIVKSNGVKGLYQGVSPNIAGAGAAWGLYFFAFNFLKASLKDQQQVENLQPGSHLLAGALAGATTLACTNPIWVIKTRMCLQPVGVVNKQHYNGVFDGLVKLYKHEGLRGYYRGFLPGLFGVSHGALQFMAYEELKKKHSSYTGNPTSTKLNPFEYIVMAALSKVFAVLSTYPYQVVRSRLQDTQMQSKYTGVMDIFKKIYRNEGVVGFYKGIVPSLLRVTPACCITFVIYENIAHYLLDK